MNVHKILRVIDSGAFGRVEEVALEDGTTCARKVFAPSSSVGNATDTEKLKVRFAREVAVQSELPENFFIPILGRCLADDPPWFLMPLCQRTLQTEIVEHQRARTLPSAALLNVLESLEFLEAANLVHRDLKPSNILLHANRWKLSDFGLVSLPTPDQSRLTSTFSAWGTEAYCAPEQRISFSQCTWKTDQYSFGCVLHDIFGSAPRIPYQTHTAPGRIGKTIERCTALTPERRFKSVADLRSALLAVIDGPGEEEMSLRALSIATILANAEEMQGAHYADVRVLLWYEGADAWAVFSALSDENLEILVSRNRLLFDAILKSYIFWVARSAFSQDFCGVVCARLETFFLLGSINQKASIALCMAKFSTINSHKYSLERLLHMCGHSLSVEVARRIVRDIRAKDFREIFLKCVEILGKDERAFHPEIARALEHRPRFA